MDSLITAAAQSLAVGDPLGALRRVALRNDPPALALRGIAMAQLGDFPRARNLLRQAFRAFSPRESVARARCVVAEAEVALVSRDLAFPARTLDGAAQTLARHGDHANAVYARLLHVRRLLLIGQLSEAERRLAVLDPAPLPPALRAGCHLLVARIAVRRLRARAARLALGQAAAEAHRAGIPSLIAEIEAEAERLAAPAARLLSQGRERTLCLDEVEQLLSTDACVVDACRWQVHANGQVVSLASRPVLFALLRTLGEAWPGESPRSRLIADAFASRFVSESHRARLRVEMGRLRKAIRPMAEIQATRQGFVLLPLRSAGLCVLAPPFEDAHFDVLALLSDGESWSSSALAVALGTSQRSVQRALEALASAGRIQSVGKGRGCRWHLPSIPDCATALLLPVAPLLA